MSGITHSRSAALPPGPGADGVYFPPGEPVSATLGQTLRKAKRRLRKTFQSGKSIIWPMTAPPGALGLALSVVQWAELLVRAAEREWVIPDMKACGQALEKHLHCPLFPPHDQLLCPDHRRALSRERPPERSKSKASVGATAYLDLFKVVLGVWSDLEAAPEPASGESRIADYSPFGRVVFPVALLDSGDFRASVSSARPGRPLWPGHLKAASQRSPAGTGPPTLPTSATAWNTDQMPRTARTRHRQRPPLVQTARPRAHPEPGPRRVRHRAPAVDDRRVPPALARGHRPGMDTVPHRPAPLHASHQDVDVVLARPQSPLPPIRPARPIPRHRRPCDPDQPRPDRHLLGIARPG